MGGREDGRSQDLWDLIEAGKKQHRILTRLRRAQALSQDDGERDQSILHPSEMAKTHWCPRHDFYRISGVPGDAEKISLELQNIFDEGHEIHDKWQRRLWDVGVLRGLFECLICNLEEVYLEEDKPGRWWDTSPKVCVHCGAPREFLRYREVPMYNQKHNIGGHADGELDDGKPPALLEVKSIGIGTVRMENPALLDGCRVTTEGGRSVVDIESLWQEIKRPFPSHVRQGMLYMWLRDVDTMIFLYESKWHQQVKEFTLRYRHEVIEDLLDQALDVGYALRREVPPARPDWAAADAGACKTCPYASTCYEENEHADDEEESAAARAREARPRRRRRAGRRAARAADDAAEEHERGVPAAEGPSRSGRDSRRGADMADGKPRAMARLLEGETRRR